MNVQWGQQKSILWKVPQDTTPPTAHATLLTIGPLRRLY